MISYIAPLKIVKKNDIIIRGHSLSSTSFKEVKFKNNNFLLLGSLLDDKTKGFEPGREEYITFSENNFIRIQDMDRLEFSFKENESTIKIIPPKKESYKKKIIRNGDLCYQTASDVGNVCIYLGEKAFYNSHIRRLKLKDNKHYIFSILKSNFGKNQVDVSGSIKGIDNFSEELLLNTKIVFPTKENNASPEKVERLISVIVQNILNKEREINKKDFLINKIFEKELMENSYTKRFNYLFPNINEVREILRLDSKMYNKDFKQFENYLENYPNGYVLFGDLKIKKEIKSRKGPNLAISVIGESIYTDVKKENLVQLILSKNVSDKGIIRKITYIGNKHKLPFLKKYDLMLFARGDIGRVLFIDDFLINSTSNFDVFFISYNSNLEEKLFLLNYLKFLKNKNYWNFFSVGGSGALSLTDNLLKRLKIPNFPKDIKLKISKLYHNKIDKIKNLNLDNYLSEENKRNESLGIFQLSLEVLQLKEILDKLIWKISNNEKIEITLDI